MTHDLTLDDAQRVITAQPFSRLVGASVTRFLPGEAALEIQIDDRHRQQSGLVHGGVIAYLADNAAAFAAGSVLGPNTVSTGLNITFIGNSREGLIVATANVVHASNRSAVCAVEVRSFAPDGSELICAVAQGGAALTGTGGLAWKEPMNAPE